MTIEQLQSYLAETYENFPQGRTIGLVVLRTTRSETIFRTEGSGEPMCSEFVQAGVKNIDIIPRLAITKRKQVAPERRKGREFLRSNNLLYTVKDKGKEFICSLNTNHPCAMCIDCFLYGFAAGKGEESGSQKSRILTEDAFSILSATDTIGERTINGVYENGTMRLKNEKTGKTEISTSLNTSEYIKPGVHFLDIVTLKDVTADELRYAIGNILLTTRYGAVSSRVGRMDNRILAVFGGIAELPSSLELVQDIYDYLTDKNTNIEHPFNTNDLVSATKEIVSNWTNRRGISMQLSDTDLDSLIADIDNNWSLEEQPKFLKRLNDSYESFRRIANDEENKEDRKKKKATAKK